MGLLTGYFWVDLLSAFLLLSPLIYWLMKNTYWDQRGVANTKGGLILNQILGKCSQSQTVKEWYDKFPGEKYFGFTIVKRPGLMIKDVNLINQILVKDFTHFQDRGQPQNKKDPMTNNLFGMRGQMWRQMRAKLIPTFTAGKLKGMFEQVSNCGANMIGRIEELSRENSHIESKDFLFEFTSDVIASCAFGLQFGPNTPEFNVFKSTVKHIFQPSVFTMIKIILFILSPKLSETLNLRPFMGKKNIDYFMNLIKTTSEYRKENNIKRNDYLQLLLTLKKLEDQGLLSHPILTSVEICEDDAVIVDHMRYAGTDQPLRTDVKLFTEETVCANSVIFLVAGSESTSSTISLTLFELARHPDIQQRLQEEVDTVLLNHRQQWCYQAIREMTYLDQVVQESQRMHPIIPFIQRECTKPYRMPGSDLVIEKGVLVCIPVAGLHRDPEHYPDPDTFKPERFEDNNFNPNPTFLPFGHGPRICIAMRFAIMEVKTSLARIMANYTVKLSPKTQVPLQMNPRSFVPSVKGGLWLQFEKRQQI